MDKRKFILVTIKNGKSLAKWFFYRDAMETDCYINVPVAKHHGLAGLTLGLKNVMGVIGAGRGTIHSIQATRALPGHRAQQRLFRGGVHPNIQFSFWNLWDQLFKNLAL